MRRPYDTLLDAHRQFGPVCQIGQGPFRYVFLLGVEANELVLSSRARDFTWREAFASLIPVDGETALVVTDGDEHDRRRRLVQPAFARKRLDAHRPIMGEEADRVIDTWRVGDTVDVYADFRRAVRRIAVRSLFGDHLGDAAEELGHHLQEAIDFANLPPLPGRDLNLPGLPFRRAMRARARADAVVFAEIARRRTTPTDDADLLSALLAAQDDQTGVGLTDQEVRDQVISLVAAGYDTTSALVAWAVYATLRDPRVEATLRAELEAADDLDDCPYLDAVVSETLRLHSPAGFAGRMAQTDVEFAGHVIPKGRLVVYSQYVTHRLPDVWPDPFAFRPERWANGWEPAPYGFVPFGGGHRRCIGFALATLEAKVLLAAVLRRTRLRLVRHDIPPTGIVSVVPRGGVPAVVTELDQARTRSG